MGDLGGIRLIQASTLNSGIVRAAPAIFRPPHVGPHKECKYCDAAVMPWARRDGLANRVLARRTS